MQIDNGFEATLYRFAKLATDKLVLNIFPIQLSPPKLSVSFMKPGRALVFEYTKILSREVISDRVFSGRQMHAKYLF